MIGNGGDLFPALLPWQTYDQIYQDGPDAIIAGSLQPGGTAEAIGGGWRIKGRWAFASGCDFADWMFGLCVMTEDGKPLIGEHGTPMMRACFLPARDWKIEDTWYVAGLKGSGSHHIAVKNKVVSAANFFDFMDGPSCLPGPLYQAVPHLLPLLHGAVSVGIAEGALDEIVEMANTGRQQQRTTVPMRDSEIFQSELGRVAAEVRAARALLQAQAASHWQHAVAGTLKEDALLTEGSQTAVWLATTCVRAVDACFALGGGAALYETSPLQRRLRDVHAVAQHAIAHPRCYISAGKLVLDSYASQLHRSEQADT
jgi:alkylation response protein AidB-like acyl-CoA dehydrogenase